MRSSISSMSSMSSSFPRSQPHHPSFPFHSEPDFSFTAYLRPMDDGDNGDRAPDDTELSIFDARKYFSEPNIDPVLISTNKVSPSIPRLSSASSTDGFSRNFRNRSFRSYATPTASSEASWNSHTGLLTNPPGAISVALRHSKSARRSGLRSDSPRWLLFRRNCPCSGEKSVQVKKSSPEPRSPAIRNSLNSRLGEAEAYSTSRIKVEDSISKIALKQPEPFMEKLQNMAPNGQRRFSNGGFTFPVMKPSMASSALPPTGKLLNHGFPPNTAVISSLPLPLTKDPPRVSVEVFQPTGDISHARRKSGEAIGFPEAGRKQRINAAVTVDDDAASDASSDLFEIESFSTNSTSFPAIYGRSRDSLDEARPRFSTAAGGGGISTTSAYDDATDCGYEPSEVSVTWSVTTAEGTAFDRASVTNYSVSASDVEEFTRIQLRQHRELEMSSGGDGGKRRGGGGGLLTSCMCEKAVSVGPNPVKSVTEKGHVASRYRQRNY